MHNASTHVLSVPGGAPLAGVSLPVRYLIAAVAVAGAAAIRGALDPVLHSEAPLLVFVAPTVVTALLAGPAAALFATALSAIVGTYFFIEPTGSVWLARVPDRVRLGLFLAENVAIVAALAAWRMTRTRRVAAATDQATRLLTAILESAPHAIVASDRNGRITAWNAAATSLLGFSAEEVLGATAQHVPPEGRASYEVRRARVLHGERFDNVPITRRRKDGSIARCQVSVVPLREPDDRIIGTVATLTEIVA